MTTTIVDPKDGHAYDLQQAGGKWVIYEAGTRDRPGDLQDAGPWDSPQQALQALRSLSERKEADRRSNWRD